MRILTVVGNRPQFIKAAAVSGLLRERPRGDAGAHRPALRRLALAGVLRRARARAPRARARDRRRHEHLADRAHAGRARAAAGRASSPTRCSSTATPTRRSPARSRRRRRGVPVVHVEAGMRSFDRAMPEELNRVADRPSQRAAAVLLADRRREPRAESVAGSDRGRGRRDGRRRLALAAGARAPTANASRAHGVEPGAYLLLTAHRAGNVDDPERLRALVELSRRCPTPVLFPLHPRTRARLREAGLLERAGATRRA